ncbi:MAG: TonB-dependent receptor [Chitinophagaceae bacterium]|nr:TonB-dependent receptor [Chitinophagaceae bacterium]
MVNNFTKICKASFLTTCLFTFFASVAQVGDSVSVRSQYKFGRVYGKVVDSKTNKGVEAASVQIFISMNDASGDKKTDSLIGGMLSRPNGDFNFDNLPLIDTFKFMISAVGFKPLQVEVFVDGSSTGVEKDLGNLKIQQDAAYLSTVTVVAQRPGLEMSIDRKIFNVEKNLTATGGTAIDVMKGIPSVTVDVEGNVLLRNNTPQIFVDGRPTILTLEQIPADNIERIELITNPSAKFDAASTGGIINVVLKKNKKLGLNGVVSLGVGTPDVLNGNLTLNLREGKFNVFASGSYNQMGGRATAQTLRQNKESGIIRNYFNQNSIGERTREFTSVRFGFDFFMDNRNTITLSQNFVKGKFTSEEEQDQEYLDENRQLDRRGDRLSDGQSSFNRSNSQLVFTHKFTRPGQQLSADITYNYGTGDDRSNILNTYFYPDGSEFKLPDRVNNYGSNENDQLTVQVDFVSPKGEDSKFETGVRSFINNFNSDYNAFSIDGSGSATKLALSNNYEYKEVVNALYATYSNKWKKFSYQLGLRAEHSTFKGELPDSAQKFGYEYPDSFKNLFDALFPSIFITKELSEGEDVQINYTRRIRRPDFWRLNPFIDINDPVNLRQGNPNLRPEFTNSFEFNYNKKYVQGSFLGVLFYRNTQGDITQYSDTISAAQFQQLNNAAIDPNAILNTFINAQSTNSLGAELTLQHTLAKNFDIVPTIEMQYQKVNAIIDQLDLSNEGFTYEAKLVTNYKIETKRSKLFNNLGFQLIGEYESSEILPQGKRKPQYSLDAAIRKDFLKNNKASLTFSVSDVFNTNRFGTIYDTERFYQDSYRRRNVRSFRLSFSYRFGKSDFKLLRRDRDNEENTDGDAEN